ncbi:hypothetical protein Tco_0626580 [Tanacetum coccineum]|uniref:Uncharacterized protein n=1 Tax=Tanacetum coccineum TaxID=301880 RepID=A0ABQ4WJZ4_9ASTR
MRNTSITSHYHQSYSSDSKSAVLRYKSEQFQTITFERPNPSSSSKVLYPGRTVQLPTDYNSIHSCGVPKLILGIWDRTTIKSPQRTLPRPFRSPYLDIVSPHTCMSSTSYSFNSECLKFPQCIRVSSKNFLLSSNVSWKNFALFNCDCSHLALEASYGQDFCLPTSGALISQSF